MYFQGNAMDNIAMTYPWSKFIGYIFSTVVEYGVNIYCNGHIIIHGYTFWMGTIPNSSYTFWMLRNFISHPRASIKHQYPPVISCSYWKLLFIDFIVHLPIINGDFPSCVSLPEGLVVDLSSLGTKKFLFVDLAKLKTLLCPLGAHWLDTHTSSVPR